MLAALMPMMLVLAIAQPDPAQPGPYRVGAITFVCRDPQRPDPAFLAEVWYPTRRGAARPGARYPSGMLTRAARNPPIADGKFPWVVFSHGMGAMREQSTFLTEHLASHGYVVVAPDHPHNTRFDLDLLGNYQSALDRPMHVRVLMDRIVASARDRSERLFGALATEQVAVIGHSLGGYTALAVGGAWTRVRDFPAAARPTQSSYYDFRDERVAAVIAFTPYCRFALDDFGLTQLDVPALIVGASEDHTAAYAQHQVPVFAHARGPRYLALIQGAAHLSFANAEFLDELPFVVRMADRPTLARDQCEAVIRRLTLAFLDRHLRDSDRYGHYLAADQPGLAIQYQPASPAPPGCYHNRATGRVPNASR